MTAQVFAPRPSVASARRFLGMGDLLVRHGVLSSMADEIEVTRREAVFTGAALVGGAALLSAKRAAGAPADAARRWESNYSGGPQDQKLLPPGQPGRDDVPTITPGGATLPWKVVDGVKVYHLVAEEVAHEFAPGLKAKCWGYNGRVHGPTLEAVEGDRVRIYVTNKLPAATTVHWHGVFLPNGMDGVGGLTQRAIRPGETFKYEYTFRKDRGVQKS